MLLHMFGSLNKSFLQDEEISIQLAFKYVQLDIYRHTHIQIKAERETEKGRERETDSIKTNIDCNLRSDFDVKVSLLAFHFSLFIHCVI